MFVILISKPWNRFGTEWFFISVCLEECAATFFGRVTSFRRTNRHFTCSRKLISLRSQIKNETKPLTVVVRTQLVLTVTNRTLNGSVWCRLYTVQSPRGVCVYVCLSVVDFTRPHRTKRTPLCSSVMSVSLSIERESTTPLLFLQAQLPLLFWFRKRTRGHPNTSPPRPAASLFGNRPHQINFCKFVNAFQ